MAIIEEASPVAPLSALRTAWPDLKWSWDGRLLTVVSSFGGEQVAQARAVTSRVLPQQFDSTSLASAPAPILSIIERSGGLRGNQLAFCGGAAACMFFGLWWPWQGGGTVSLRVGLVSANEDPALTKQLRELFGASS